MLQLERLGKLNKFSGLTRTQTCDLPACSIVPQPSTLPHALIMMQLEEKCELLPLCALYLLGSYC
jgi:hypothetical protein